MVEKIFMLNMKMEKIFICQKDVYTLGKYDITNIVPSSEITELTPVKEFNISLYTNFLE